MDRDILAQVLRQQPPGGELRRRGEPGRVRDGQPHLLPALVAQALDAPCLPAPRRRPTHLGVTLYPEDDTDAEGLIRHADQAMYEVKNSGRNGWDFYTKEIQKSILDIFIDTAYQI